MVYVIFADLFLETLKVFSPILMSEISCETQTSRGELLVLSLMRCIQLCLGMQTLLPDIVLLCCIKSCMKLYWTLPGLGH